MFRVQKNGVDDDVREAFIGHKTILSLLSFIIGGILVGSTLWEIFHHHFGPLPTIILGLVSFIIGGVLSQEFRK